MDFSSIFSSFGRVFSDFFSLKGEFFPFLVIFGASCEKIRDEGEDFPLKKACLRNFLSIFSSFGRVFSEFSPLKGEFWVCF